MATQTPNLGLTKPELTDEIPATILALADNFGDLDTALSEIVESGSNANGDYVRFADGTQIALTATTTTAINSPHGSVFISAVHPGTPWPAAFTSTPAATPWAHSDSGNAPRFAGYGTGYGSATVTPPTWAMAPVSTANTATLRFIGIGRWK